jgi:hypothetical protein
MRRFLLVLLVVVLGGCTWPMARYDPARSGHNPFESTINLDNVGQLGLVAGVSLVNPGEPVVAHGKLYVADQPSNTTADVHAYDANCTTRCRVKFAAPGTEPALDRNILFARDRGEVVAYDAHGQERCGGTPIVCAPLWRAVPPPPPGEGTAAGIEDYVVVGDVLIAQVKHVTLHTGFAGLFVVAFDARGIDNCTTSEPRVCSPLWSVPTGFTFEFFTRRLAFTAGHAIVVGVLAQKIGAFDARGVVWSATGPYDSNPLAADGLVWAPRSRSNEVDAFDAAGVRGCTGSPPLCMPRRTAVVPARVTGLAAADGMVYVGAADGRLYVFDAKGNDGCTGTPLRCAPLWSAIVFANADVRDPTIAGGVVFAPSGEPGLSAAFDARGEFGCGGTPKECGRLGSGGGPNSVVVNGRLYSPGSQGVDIFEPRPPPAK